MMGVDTRRPSGQRWGRTNWHRQPLSSQTSPQPQRQLPSRWSHGRPRSLGGPAPTGAWPGQPRGAGRASSAGTAVDSCLLAFPASGGARVPRLGASSVLQASGSIPSLLLPDLSRRPPRPPPPSPPPRRQAPCDSAHGRPSDWHPLSPGAVNSLCPRALRCSVSGISTRTSPEATVPLTPGSNLL
uniref:Uncharacterized protein n=1 Tax=Molossus molossus TaxID=27622 RepID=A0A7J8HCK1_MOLMO|nr:hypothetical protein HJG59_011217 [Molossus molossus]